MIVKLRKKLDANIHLKEILIGSTVTFVLKMSGMLLGYVVVLIIARRYGAEGIGMYNLTLSITTFVAMIASMGMNMSILRYVGQFNKTGEEYKLKLLYRYAVEMVVPFSLMLAVLLYFSAEIIALQVFKNPIYESTLQIAAFIIPFMALQNISVEYIRGLGKLKVSEFLRSVNRPIFNIVLLIVLGMFVIDQMLPLYTLGAGTVASAIFALYYILQKNRDYENAERKEFLKRELVSTSMPMMVTMIASFLMGDITIYILQIYTTAKYVGIFSTVVKISLLVGIVLMVVNTVLAPKFSVLYWSGKLIELQRILSFTTTINLLISSVFAIGIVLLSDKILLLFGNEFIEGKYALYVLLVSQVINVATGSAGLLLNMTGFQNIAKNILLFSLLITISSSFILIPLYGIMGASYTVLLGSVVLRGLNVYYVKKSIGLVTLPNYLKKRK